jgi:hypothetical protein
MCGGRGPDDLQNTKKGGALPVIVNPPQPSEPESVDQADIDDLAP